MAGCFSASVVVGFDLAVRGGSRLACQRRPRVEENCQEMVTLLRKCATLSVDSSLGRSLRTKTQLRVRVVVSFRALACVAWPDTFRSLPLPNDAD